MTGKMFSCFCVSMFVWPVMLSGCGSRQAYNKKYFLLSATRQAQPAGIQTDLVLEVRRFTIDSAFAGKGLVYRTGQFEYESDFYSEFLVSPAAMITEKTRNWLSGSGLFKRVLDTASQIDPTHTLEANITALYGDLRDKSSPQAKMEMRVFLLKAQAAEEPILVFGQTYKSSVGIESEGPEGLVEALDRCLANILSNLEKDLAQKHAGATVSVSNISSLKL
ncbi:MAG: membrane integrity-associated transporter subunit PqiC [Planctomycetes bacterium]|nr:membrane integrity-associated transporter subunit PqiC [Planctomycetota bacterium]MBL7185274.1 membrane integrity-associated transporter subunit PqiC [Phycisphaerae bacterium]